MNTKTIDRKRFVREAAPRANPFEGPVRRADRFEKVRLDDGPHHRSGRHAPDRSERGDDSQS